MILTVLNFNVKVSGDIPNNFEDSLTLLLDNQNDNFEGIIVHGGPQYGSDVSRYMNITGGEEFLITTNNGVLAFRAGENGNTASINIPGCTARDKDGNEVTSQTYAPGEFISIQRLDISNTEAMTVGGVERPAGSVKLYGDESNRLYLAENLTDVNVQKYGNAGRRNI